MNLKVVSVRAFGCIALLGVLFPAFGRNEQAFRYDAQPWVETEVKDLPIYPDESALLPVTLLGSARYRYFVDSRTISIGEDGVVRFSLAIKTEAAGHQMSYVGIRCQSREWKTYAFGVSSGKWRRPVKPTWELIERKTQENHRHELYSTYFCSGNAASGNEKKLLANLRTPPKTPYR